MKTTTLYRPVGQTEMDLIHQSGEIAFPPRLDWQPIFYPVTNQAYAAQIARDWNSKDKFSGFVGYVTAFDVDSIFLSKYDIQNVGTKEHNEYWIPAEKLAEFNQNIVGKIRVLEVFKGNR